MTGTERFARLLVMAAGRSTVRLRLTALYSLLFLLSGAVLLTITYLLVEHNPNAVFIYNTETKHVGHKLTLYRHRVSGQGALKALGSLKARPSLPGFRQAQALAEKALRQHGSDVHTLLIGSIAGLAGMAVLSVLLGWVVAGRALRPVRTMTATAQRISAHNLHERLAIEGPQDELRQLADTINDLLARLEAAFSTQRHFVANASHELRTPLTLQRTLLEVVLADPGADIGALRKACERAVAAGEANERLIESLLTLATSERGLDARERVDVAALAAQVLMERRLDANARQVHLEAALLPAVTFGSPQLLERLVTNLVDNALRHNVPGGWARVATGAGRGAVTLSVRNSGPLVPAEEIDRLLEPFQRLDNDAGGVGLGLSIVRAVARAHGAAVACTAKNEGGLEVEISFPVGPEYPIEVLTRACTSPR
jgi:signal transduction histidine kinase